MSIARAWKEIYLIVNNFRLSMDACMATKRRIWTRYWYTLIKKYYQLYNTGDVLRSNSVF